MRIQQKGSALGRRQLGRHRIDRLFLLLVELDASAIPASFDQLGIVERGRDDSPEGRAEGFTHSVLMTFADEAARQRYLPHPDQDALKAIFRPVLERIIVLDYTLQPGDAVAVGVPS